MRMVSETYVDKNGEKHYRTRYTKEDPIVPDYSAGIPTASTNSRIVNLILRHYSPNTKVVAYFDPEDAMNRIIVVSPSEDHIKLAIDSFLYRNSPRNNRINKMKIGDYNSGDGNGLVGACYILTENPKMIPQLNIPDDILLIRVKNLIPKDSNGKRMKKIDLEAIMQRLLPVSTPPKIMNEIER